MCTRANPIDTVAVDRGVSQRYSCSSTNSSELERLEASHKRDPRFDSLGTQALTCLVCGILQPWIKSFMATSSMSSQPMEYTLRGRALSFSNREPPGVENTFSPDPRSTSCILRQNSVHRVPLGCRCRSRWLDQRFSGTTHLEVTSE